MMKKEDIVELAIKLLAVFYGFKLAVSLTLILAGLPLKLISINIGYSDPYAIIIALVSFLIAAVMSRKCDMIVGWLFKKKYN